MMSCPPTGTMAGMEWNGLSPFQHPSHAPTRIRANAAQREVWYRLKYRRDRKRNLWHEKLVAYQRTKEEAGYLEYAG